MRELETLGSRRAAGATAELRRVGMRAMTAEKHTPRAQLEMIEDESKGMDRRKANSERFAGAVREEMAHPVMSSTMPPCKHGHVGACGFCMSGTEPDLRARPTNGPPNPQAIAEDLRMRARRLDKISDQLRTEASDLFFAANRIEEMAR